MASGRACANVRRDDRREASARPRAAWVALPSSQRALLAGRSHSRRVWRHSPTPTRLGDIAPWLKLRVWGKHILVGRDRSRDTCESRSHVYAMLCYVRPPAGARLATRSRPDQVTCQSVSVTSDLSVDPAPVLTFSRRETCRWADGRARADQGGRSCTRLLPASTSHAGHCLGLPGERHNPTQGGGAVSRRASRENGTQRWLARLHALPSGSPHPMHPLLMRCVKIRIRIQTPCGRTRVRARYALNWSDVRFA